VAKNAEPTIAVKFARDFEGHKAGEVVEMTPSQLFYFQEWDCIEVIAIPPEPDPAMTVRVKRSKKAE
jgi:hypothetical protein